MKLIDRILKRTGVEKYFAKKTLLGFALGLLLAIIVQNVDRKLWFPLELEIINTRNILTNDDKAQTGAAKEIALVLFDDKTQFLLRQNGLPIKDFEKKGRDLLVKCIENLEKMGVKKIGINLNLNNPSGTQSDKRLIQTITKHQNIVVADSLHSFPSYPLGEILKHVSGAGYGELFADYDRVVHKVGIWDNISKNIPSFSYALFKLGSNKDLDRSLKTRNEFYLRSPKSSFTSYSLIDLLENELNPSEIKGKTVIIGIGLRSKLMRDQLYSPIDRSKFLSDTEVQATALSNLISNSCFYKLGLRDFKFSFLFLGMFLGGIFSLIPVVKRLITFFLLLLTFILISQVAYAQFDLILELVPVIFLLLGNLIIGSLIHMQLNLQKQNVKLEKSQVELQSINEQLIFAFSELKEKISELQGVRKQLATRSEEERKRIARDLHDDTLARITDLKRQIEKSLYSTEITEKMKQEFQQSLQSLNYITQEVRIIINALRPSMLDNVLGIIPAIENLLDDLVRRSEFKIKSKFQTNLSTLKLSESNEIHLYRIIQEALNNVVKHSEADFVEILMEKQPGQVLVLISDDGKGFNPDLNDKKGFGLVDMKERAELIGAHIQFVNKPIGSGSSLEITIPVDKIDSIRHCEEAQSADEAIY